MKEQIEKLTLTSNQIMILTEIYNDGCILVNDIWYNKKTTQSLLKRGLIKIAHMEEYGDMYQITDKGIKNLPMLY